MGFGYDIHRFAPNRKLILGGVRIPSKLGLLGHSDADVLLHAICDAMLGAAALGDIGKHFPDTDKRFKDASSSIFVREVTQLLFAHRFEVVNIDSTIVLQSPKLAPFIPKMQRRIAKIVGLELSQVSIKATTNERLGALGSGEGCAAYAVALIQSLLPD
ncbi:MAG TPA: 2-C-methyl-D-erythritol 2,4-cyclodiphosphate synthase [Terriglobia bacterium]|nr:2-C-methyl-D-erythritol 2,4-cyclodiphosphate synthase [Terriglobia bacterium]